MDCLVMGVGHELFRSACIGLTVFASCVAATPGSCGAVRMERFTVTEDIGVTQFDGPPLFSPDRRYFLVKSDRGRVDLNRAESSIRVYLVKDVSDALSHPMAPGDVAQLFALTQSTYKYGPIVTDVRWLADSSGFVFLAKTQSGNNQLSLIEMRTKKVVHLTPESQDVTGFDVRDRKRFVYAALSSTIQENVTRQKQAAIIPGTGNLYTLLFPEEVANRDRAWCDLSELWAVNGRKHFRVLQAGSSRAFPIHTQGQKALALSPDGRYVVTVLTVKDVPVEWEALYPARYSTHPDAIRAGAQDPAGCMGRDDVSEYVLVDLFSGNSRNLIEAPIGSNIGWNPTSASVNWSADGESIVLSNTFLPPATQLGPQDDKRPCIAVADLVKNTVACVQPVAERLDPENIAPDRKDAWQFVSNAHFVDGDKNIIVIARRGVALKTTLVHQPDGSWKVGAPSEREPTDDSLRIFVREDLNHSPLLMAVDRGSSVSRVIWDPNPQLRHVKLGQVSVFKWTDKDHREWTGGLFKPPDYVVGKRYPLVIQNHGFAEDKFAPSGAYTTSFAAQELAAEGLVVLQIRDCPIRVSQEEAPCQVAGYEAAVDKLTQDGLVEPERIGIIGFSRTCYYVLQALTTGTIHFRAALIADGVNEGYMQYMVGLDIEHSQKGSEEPNVIGAQPFGEGLSLWLKRSPVFNMDKVTAPLEVVATGKPSLLLMWEPYAALKYLHKPVDLVVLNSSEHVFTNPAQRLISEGITIDWFRFWLQDYKDPDPTKQGQYKRWESLRMKPNSMRRPN